MWRITITTTFKHRYKRLDRDLKKADDAVKTLTESSNPLLLGRRKRGRLKGFYGYPISNSCRILYTVNWDVNMLYLMRICGHKHVYK